MGGFLGCHHHILSIHDVDDCETDMDMNDYDLMD